MRELTLQAALRDLHSSRESARHVAIRSLAPALLAELDLNQSRWACASLHPQGQAVVDALMQMGQQPGATLEHGFALLGLGRLAEPRGVALITAALALAGTLPVQIFVRECAVIAAAELAWTAVGSDRRDVYDELTAALHTSLQSEHEEVRFQCYAHLGELVAQHGTPTQREALLETLLAAAHREHDPRLVAAVCDTLANFKPVSSAIIHVWEKTAAKPWPPTPWLRDDERLTAHWTALRLLALHENIAAAQRLGELLDHHHTIDNALEALARLGTSLPGPLRERIAALALRQNWWISLTQVRAAYALLCAGDPRGDIMLRRCEKSLRPSIRQAVTQARQLAQQLSV